MPSIAAPRAEATARTNRGPAAAAENRRALIAAAREVYAEGGLGALRDRAERRAGVGQGSLYRHFPDRTALAVAVFEDNVRDLEEYTSAPDRTVDDLLDRVVEQAVVSTALIELITADLSDPRVAHLGERYFALVERLVARDRAAGRVGAPRSGRTKRACAAHAAPGGQIARPRLLHRAGHASGRYRRQNEKTRLKAGLFGYGSPGRIRTSECLSQSQVPYRLATGLWSGL